MIRRIFDRKEFEPILSELLYDHRYSDPHLHTQEQLNNNLYASLQKPNDYFFAVYEGETMTGLFDFLVLAQDRYLEMIVGLSRSASAYREMLDFVRASWPGFQADFVFNPRNDRIKEQLAARGAAFDVEQRKMVLGKPKLDTNAEGIELLSQSRFPEYAAIHSKDVYWTAERIVAAPDRFRALLAIENGHVVGYLDVTVKYKENEIYDLFVLEAFRRRGWGRRLLARAIELNRPNDMMLLVDADNDPARELYLSAGFVEDPGGNNQTATWMLPK